MIRKAISCDICATEKRQTNHWFVAYEQAGELRISGWNSRHRQRPDSKHLCGQTCLHKLVDEFMAKSIAVRPQRSPDTDESAPASPAVADASLPPARRMLSWNRRRDCSRRLRPFHPNPLPSPARTRDHAVMASLRTFRPSPEKPRPASRNWRAEAWERERERELRAIENRPDIAERRRSSA